MKRKLLALFMALAMSLVLVACGGSAKEETATESAGAMAPMEDAFMDMEYGGNLKAEMPAPEMEETIAESQTQGNTASAVAEKKFIITANMELETTSFDEAVSGLEELTEAYGGWFENSSVANRKSGSRWASYTVRVPASRYEDFMNKAGSLCHETWRESNSEEITDIYYDTQGRLKTQQIKLERLQSLLAKAELMEDIITIESAISETEWQIENLSGTLRHYDSKVDYATVHININEVYKLSNVEQVPDSFADRMGKAFKDGLRSFVDNMEDLAVSFAYSWMWWLLVVVVVVVVVRVVRKRPVKLPRLRRKKAGDKNDEI